MGILTFKGGVHPYDGKELSKNSPVVKYLPKGDMVYPLSQHIGAPAAPVVQKGDHVLAGQKIADAAGFVSSPIHASVSGTVKGIEPRLTATGSTVNSIIIENDQQYESVEFTPARLEDLSKEEILARIKEGGVVGMGGAGFPTQVKLAPKEPDKIDFIIDSGDSELKLPSTIIKIVNNDLLILREGSISKKDIKKVLGGTINVK